MRIVVCDDDSTLRGVVTKLATVAGHHVLAETDSGPDAVEMVLRFKPEVLIIDLDLAWGAGIQAVRDLREAGSPVQIVVFTNWATNSPEVRAAEVRAAIEKPDFESLERVLAALAAGLAAESPAGADRREPPAARPDFPAHGRLSSSGLEEPETFDNAVLRLEPGDAVLIVHVAGLEYAVGWYDLIAASDQVLAVARLLRAVLRTQDRLSVVDPVLDERPADLIALVLGGAGRGVESIWRRLQRAHEVSSLPGIISAGWAMCDEGVAGPVAVSRAADAANRSIGRPAGDRLWAG
jgi:DNA-binding response OmpR family regulator